MRCTHAGRYPVKHALSTHEAILITRNMFMIPTLTNSTINVDIDTNFISMRTIKTQNTIIIPLNIITTSKPVCL